MNNNKKRKYFGTDGIRGRVGDDRINPDFILKLGRAAGRVLAGKGHGPVLVGKDTRISGYMLESALEAGLAAAGADIGLLGPMPTPAIAFLTRATAAQAGIVISASHNPFSDNGVKFFAADGGKLSDAVELEIERELDRPPQCVDSADLGKASRIEDAPRRYIEFCQSGFSGLDLGGLRIVLDCANGAAYQIAPAVFTALGAGLECIGVSPDGLNINAACGATSIAALRQRVTETRADLGIALDGDADRLIMVNHNGARVDGDDILYIIAACRRKRLNGGVVGTVMSNLGLERAIRGLGLQFPRAPVGDRYVAERLRRENLILGGETSGHIINLDKAATGDGIIAALQVLEAMTRQDRPLVELTRAVIKMPQVERNIELKGKTVDLDGNARLNAALKDVKKTLGDSGRAVLRPSGTEPLVRIMVEGEDPSLTERLAEQLADIVRRELKRL